jgi:hypothetical protein
VSLDFAPSSRGWCYSLEEHGLAKGDFDTAENLINECRKNGMLPLDICGEDDKRSFENIESVDWTSVESEAQWIVDSIRRRPAYYTPISFWDDQPYYVQMLVEKIDIRRLFAPVCAPFKVPIANAGGWSDLNGRADMMRRFKAWEGKGKQCVLLYCGNFDPGGLWISDFLRSNLADLSAAVGWSPDNLIIDRFGLDFDFIQAHGLTWIDNLITGTGKDLADTKHNDHFKPYVQEYLSRYCTKDAGGRWIGRKVESNALLAPRLVAVGKGLCRQAILKYLPEDAPSEYLERLEPLRDQVRVEVLRLLEEEFGSGAAP